MSHRVINKYHVRVNEDGSVDRFEVGDEIEPNEKELEAFPDRFREMDQPTARRRRSVESGDSGSQSLPLGASKDANKE